MNFALFWKKKSLKKQKNKTNERKKFSMCFLSFITKRCHLIDWPLINITDVDRKNVKVKKRTLFNKRRQYNIQFFDNIFFFLYLKKKILSKICILYCLIFKKQQTNLFRSSLER